MKRFPLLFSIWIISFTLRIVFITASLNTDEGLWIYRGSQFVKNLLAADLTDTYLKHHPGVPNMWLTGIGMLLNCHLNQLFPGFFGINLPDDTAACLSIEQFPINLFIIPRIVQAIVTSACTVCLYILIEKLLGKAVALCSICLLLFEPFFLAYQRFITTDALQADFASLGILLFILYLQRDRDRKLLLASGACVGLATSAKITALFLSKAFFLVIALIELKILPGFKQKGWKARFQDFGLWVATILGVFVLVFPAMWVSPGFVLTKIYKGVLQESDRGFLFFLGQLTHSPGILFYPLVLAYRLSPLLQVGLLVTTAIFAIPKLRYRLKNTSAIAALGVICLCVLAILSASDNKIDRYINLFLPLLGILAAVGWLNVAGWMGQKLIHPGLAIALSVLQLIFLVPHHPYYLTYYNPLLGGSKAAENIFMIGQGEGLERAAQWLQQSPNAKEMKVASWYRRYFSSYFPGQVLAIDKRIQDNVQPWTQAHRLVFYKNQLQRQLPEPKMLEYFSKQQPLYTVQIDGVEYVRVYPGPMVLADDIKRIQHPLAISSGEVRLLGYDRSQISADQVAIAFYWEFKEPLASDALIKISLRDRQGNVSNSDGLLVGGYILPDRIAANTILRDVHLLKLPSNINAQNYQLEVRWYSPSKGDLGKAFDFGLFDFGF